MSFFPPNALSSPNDFVVFTKSSLSATTLSFKPRIDLVLSTCKCNFSLLISKQGSKESFEIALFSAVLQPCSFSPPQLLCMHTVLSVFGCHSLLHTSNCPCRGPPFIYIPHSSHPPLTLSRCSYRFIRQALVVLLRRSHRTSRLLTNE